MSRRERLVIVAILTLVSVVVTLDLFSDAREGALNWHILVEAMVGMVAIFGIFYVLRGTVVLKHRLDEEVRNFSAYKEEAEVWRAESKKYVEGLSQAIDQQLSKWQLSPAEKEVAFLLLKGLSLKEIAEIRHTTEKTARVQSMAIYSKAELAGRSELSAFFLEDLLVPTSHMEN